jgi:hypothetical protein
MSEVTLNCIVKESPDAVFKVAIDRKKDVVDLKDVIKEKLPVIFQNIDIIGIKVWFVEINQNDERLRQLKDDDKSIESVFEKIKPHEAYRELFPLEYYLSKLKNASNDKYIHVIVQGRRIVLRHPRNLG